MVVIKKFGFHRPLIVQPVPPVQIDPPVLIILDPDKAVENAGRVVKTVLAIGGSRSTLCPGLDSEN